MDISEDRIRAIRFGLQSIGLWVYLDENKVWYTFIEEIKYFLSDILPVYEYAHQTSNRDLFDKKHTIVRILDNKTGYTIEQIFALYKAGATEESIEIATNNDIDFDTFLTLLSS